MFTKEQVRVHRQESIYQGFMSLSRLTLEHALFRGGKQFQVQRELVMRAKAVGVLLYDPRLEQFVLVEQFRVGALEDKESPWLLEIVAGIVEGNEKGSQVAHRESMEEAGASIQKLIPMQSYWVSPGWTNEQIELYLGLIDADTVSQFAGLESEQEDIKVWRIDKTELLKMLQQGRINNAMALIAIQWFFLNEARLSFSD